MHTVVDLDVPAPAELVWPHIADLASYPAWMRLVHRADAVDGADEQARWDVELRARVGPLARSKRLRMARTVYEPIRLVRFERDEFDDRDHAQWILTATLDRVGDDSSTLVMDLVYTGTLWTAGLLDRAFESEIHRGKEGLLRVLS